MSKFFSCLLIIFLATGLVVNEAAAKRFGGGRSFGIQRSKSSLFSSSHLNKNKTSFNQVSKNNKWSGLLGGLVIGSLLTSLFMGHGFGTGILSWIVLGSLIFFLFHAFLRRKAFNTVSGSPPPINSFAETLTEKIKTVSYPNQFASEDFLREAKVKFIRLQQAVDQKNFYDLSQFTTPEVYAEILMQLDELGDEPSKTEVLSLKVELLNTIKQANSWLSSVKFNGLIKENDNSPEAFEEIWHFSQFEGNKHWVVSGVQQEINEAL